MFLEPINILDLMSIVPFYIELGLTEGAVSQLLSSIKRILISEKRDRKRVRAYEREYSVEI